MRPDSTLRAIAAEARLSVATVSNILGGRYKGNTPKGRQRTAQVVGLAQRFGYVANATARRLRDGKHHAVIVMIPVDTYGMPTVFAYEYLMGISSGLQPAKMSVLVHPLRRDLARGHGDGLGDGHAELPRERAFDAALVLDEVMPGLEEWLSTKSVPAVYVNVDAAPGRVVFNRDEYAAGGDLVRELARIGWRKILLVGGSMGAAHFSYDQRRRGVSEAANELGMHFSHLDTPWWYGQLGSGLERLRPDPDTVLVAIDAHAALVLQKHAPRGSAVACCDSPHLFQELLPSLTRARFDRQALGKLAAEALLALLADPRAQVARPPIAFGVAVGSSTPPRS